MTIKDINRVENYIKRQLRAYKKAHVEVGIRSGLNKDGVDIADYAVNNEFGVYVPERSFFRSTLKEQENKYAKTVTDTIDDILDLRAANYVIALSRIGHTVVNDIKTKIASNIPPENAPATKEKKGGSVNAVTTTLIDTGALINAVNYRVVN